MDVDRGRTAEALQVIYTLLLSKLRQYGLES